MNTKRRFRTLMLVGGLALATWAFAQTAFKADGIIESTQGGFKFPDESIQATAYSSSVEYYEQQDNWSGNSPTFYCYFDVPAGKILMIEKISGYGAGADRPLELMILLAGNYYNYSIPTVFFENSSVSYFETKDVGYAEDSNSQTDEWGNTRDFYVRGLVFQNLSNFTIAKCVLSGRLYDAPNA